MLSKRKQIHLTNYDYSGSDAAYFITLCTQGKQAYFRKPQVAQYIADEINYRARTAKELMLIIELDGITHDNEVSLVKDNRREEWLAKAGFKIVRFTDEEVLKNMAGVISELERIIGEIEASPPLIPRQRGTGHVKVGVMAKNVC